MSRVPAKQSHKLKEALASYVAYLKARGSAKDTLRRPLYLYHHMSLWGEGKDVREITEEDVFEFTKRLDDHRNAHNGKPLKRSTKFSLLETLRGFFRFLEQGHFILVNPARDLKLEKPLHLPKALSISKVKALIDLHDPHSPLGQRNRTVLELLYGTGLRLSECQGLELKDVDFSSERVLVKSGKGRKDRYVPLVGRAKDALLTYLRETRPLFTERRDVGALFIGARGARLSHQSIQILVRESGKKLGLRIHPHVLRHSFATHLLEGGASVVHVQKLLGHSNIGNTQVYMKVGPRSVRRMIDEKHPRERQSRRRPR